MAVKRIVINFERMESVSASFCLGLHVMLKAKAEETFFFVLWYTDRNYSFKGVNHGFTKF